MQRLSHSSQQISAEHNKITRIARTTNNSALATITSGLVVLTSGELAKNLDHSIQEQCFNNRSIPCQISKKLPSNPMQTARPWAAVVLTLPACSLLLISSLVSTIKNNDKQLNKYIHAFF